LVVSGLGTIRQEIDFDFVRYLTGGGDRGVHEKLLSWRVFGSAGVDGCDKASLSVENQAVAAIEPRPLLGAIRRWP
jgi:hypothetical protein